MEGEEEGGPGASMLKCRVQCSQLWQCSSSVHNQKEACSSAFSVIKVLDVKDRSFGSSGNNELQKDSYSCTDQSTSYLHVQSLRNFPTEKLCGEVVVVRLDSALLLGHLGPCTFSLERALLTIKYLYKARAKVVIVTSWDTVLQSDNLEIQSIDSFAEYLSSLLQVEVIPVDGAPGLTLFKQEEWVQNSIVLFENLLNFRGEVANCNDFSQKLASGAAIFVNDSFSLSHKILASTVGITRFCYASLAGFHFEEELTRLIKIKDTARHPYIAIIGGSNFLRKAPALRMLTSLCDGLFFVGKLSFQIMNGLGMLVPSQFIERNAVMEVLQIIQVARDRNIPIYYPTDLWCLNNDESGTLGVINSTGQLDGWTPADIGPSTLEKASSIIPLYKKILWIGPTNYDLAEEFSVGATQLGQILEKASFDSCEVILVGSAACNALKRKTDSSSQYIEFQNATVVWEFLKGRILPGIAALDKRYPYQIRWSTVFCDPTLPLVVDIGSGNGLFLFQMAKGCESSNFLGLEMNEKCPNPDFNKEQNRWRMVRRMLVEAVADLLQANGQVYLQSDVESVLLGMKEQFLAYGKGQLVVDGDDGGHRMENPFGVVSDWERHILARGAPMYRTMLRKV
ncbi:Phosphoglycerate kinase [Dichanthelium oligosanthes]|uniref:Phosphoglycerate kinase n=1 Tax=Dichanthelium oligosanthes TaxID=888268 RepID=A0A1E5VI54_9POAL|nr:Phosphoglycerate kinase [Dichanthelium oligosanthes]